MTLQEVKDYLRISYDDEDTFINLCLNNANRYIKNAITDYDTKIHNADFKNQVDLISLALVQDMYDNRSPFTKDVEKYKLMFGSILMQMEYCEYL